MKSSAWRRYDEDYLVTRRFQYRAVTVDGRETSGEADALDPFALARDLSPRGLILIDARPVRASGQWGGLFSFPVSQTEVTSFLSELSLLLQSGQPVDEALGLLADGMSGQLGRIVRSIRTDLLKGKSFIDAMSRHPDTFSAEVLALVRISESTGSLDRAIEAAVRQRTRTNALTEKLAGSLRYPAFLLVAAAGVLVFFLLYVIPQFADVIKDSGGNAGGAITGIIAASDQLRAHLDLFIGGLVALLVASLAAARSKPFRKVVIGQLIRLPVIKGTIELSRSTLFCMNLGTLIGQGVPMSETLKVLELVLDGAAAETLSRIGDSVRRGGALADALEEVAFLPKIALRMIKIGEESGELAEIASRAGMLYEKKLEQRLDGIASLVGPIAILCISGLIGGLMVTIMTALISLNQLAN